MTKPVAQPSTITLKALEGATPLADERVRSTVIATANAIAERSGVDLIELSATDDAITVTLDAPRLAAIGFAAELRRITTRWHSAKFNEGPLWGERPAIDDEDDFTYDIFVDLDDDEDDDEDYDDEPDDFDDDEFDDFEDGEGDPQW